MTCYNWKFVTINFYIDNIFIEYMLGWPLIISWLTYWKSLKIGVSIRRPLEQYTDNSWFIDEEMHAFFFYSNKSHFMTQRVTPEKFYMGSEKLRFSGSKNNAYLHRLIFFHHVQFHVDIESFSVFWWQPKMLVIWCEFTNK